MEKESLGLIETVGLIPSDRGRGCRLESSQRGFSRHGTRAGGLITVMFCG